MNEDTKEDETLSEKELHVLEMARMKKLLAQSQMEAADSAYNHMILQISMKYSIVEGDIINEQGKIVRKAK